MTTENTLFGVRDVVADAIERLQGYAALAEPDGYWLAYSGGKDSVVILELAKMAGVKFEAHHSLTTIDPPELVRFVRDTPGVIIDRPKKSFFQIAREKRFLPLRHQRWCCRELKEGGGKGRLVITGVRWAESVRRSKRKMFDVCYRSGGRRFLHPIIDWTAAQVWSFIRSRNLPYCLLYDKGFKRLGCLFCPMAQPWERMRQLERYPKYAEAFRRLCRDIYKLRLQKNPDINLRWADGDAMFDWWISDYSPQIEDGGLFT
jgi:phosphoadenosine phosphosulfate reductase